MSFLTSKQIAYFAPKYIFFCMFLLHLSILTIMLKYFVYADTNKKATQIRYYAEFTNIFSTLVGSAA
nr:MAG TPA: hypothetical protein [Bacteriophage sp.]DAJ05212.1 MAG TPA: hypothetical protein [Caudoviricetes sp.]